MSNSPESLPSQSEERRFGLKLAVVLAVLLLVPLIAMVVRSDSQVSQFPRVRLPDGTWLVARAVTVGKNHAVQFRLPMQEQLQRWALARTIQHTSADNRMAIWLTRVNAKGQALDLEWFHKAEIAITDDLTIHADHFHLDHMKTMSSGGSGTGRDGFSDSKSLAASSQVHSIACARCDFPLLRPREGTFRLKVYDGSRNVVAELDIPYPKLPIEPDDDWELDPLPVSRNDGNLKVTLKRVEFRRSHEQDELRVQPILEFLHDDQPSTTWYSSGMLTDPLGNSAYIWRTDLSTMEPIWKLDLTLSQNPKGRFVPEERGKLPAITIPADGQVTYQSIKQIINGVAIDVIGVIGKGPQKFTLPLTNTTIKTGEYKAGESSTGMSWSNSSNKVEITLYSGHPCVITSNSGQGHNVAMLATDQDGESLSTTGWSSGHHMLFWHFEPKQTSKSVTVEFIVEKQRHVQFFIAPPKPEDIKQQ